MSNQAVKENGHQNLHREWGLNAWNISDSTIDQLAALAQAESHFRSENIKLGIRHGMRSGKTVLNHTQFLGYTKRPDGAVQIVPEEAEIVRKIFDRYIQGNGIGKIKRYLEEHEIKTVTGESGWSTSTIDRMLSYPIFKDEALSPPPAVRRNAPAGGGRHRAVRQCGGSSWARQGLPAGLSPNEACLLSE